MGLLPSGYLFKKKNNIFKFVSKQELQIRTYKNFEKQIEEFTLKD